MDEAVDPVTHDTKGTRLRIMNLENTAPAVDRAPFVNVDEGKTCGNVTFDTGHVLGICHETRLTNDGHGARPR